MTTQHNQSDTGTALVKSRRPRGRTDTTVEVRTFSGFTDADLKPHKNTVSFMDILARNSGLAALRAKNTEKGSLGALKFEVVNYAMSDLRVDQGAYQRLENVPHVTKIAEKFDADAFQMPLVCVRNYNGGEKVLIDAQQRCLGAFVRGYDTVQCIAVKVESLEEEAKLFRLINICRKKVPTAATHRNSLLADDDQSAQVKALRLEGAVRAAGFEVYEKDGPKRVKGITRLHSTATTYTTKLDGDEEYTDGYSYITHALKVYDAIWPGHKRVHVYLLSGLTMLSYLADMDQDSEFDLLQNHALRTRIREVFPDVIRDAVALGSKTKVAEQHRLRSDYHWVSVLLTEAAKGRRGRPLVTGGMSRLLDRLNQTMNLLLVAENA